MFDLMIKYTELMPDEDRQLLMNFLLDSVQLHEKRQDNGWWVKSVRFKVVIDIDGQLYDQIEVGDQNSLPIENSVETVVLLSKGEIQSKKINVDFSLEDMDMS